MSESDTKEEMFDVFDEENNGPIDQRPRSEVHRTGLWHRSVHVLVFNRRGELLIQQRSATKDICPNAWDLSCAEHLQPGEAYVDGAVRGLREELGIHVDAAQLEATRSDVLRLQTEHGDAVRDYEFNQCFKLADQDAFTIDDDEVAAAHFIALDELEKRIAAADDSEFAPWFLKEWALFRRSGE